MVKKTLQKRMLKKSFAAVLAASMLVGSMPAIAETTTDDIDSSLEMSVPWDLEKIGTDEAISPIQISEVAVETTSDEEEEDNEYSPIVHEETIDEVFEFPESSESVMPSDTTQQGDMSLFSLSSDDATAWQSMYNQMFGDSYLKPYGNNGNGQRVTGNTNRLVIEETDLSLPGKNGLDLVLTRRYDNQDYDTTYSYAQSEEGDYFTTVQLRYCYKFKNTSTDEALYVAFLTADQMYTYMYQGCHIKYLSTSKQKTYTTDGVTIQYYDFEDIASNITTDESYTEYVYDNTGTTPITIREEYEDASQYTIESRKILNNNGRLSNNWSLIIPEAHLYRYSSESNDDRTVYNDDYVGAFRDINGNVYTLDGYDKYTKATSSTSATYTSTFTPDNNKSLYFESIYNPQTLYENGPQYNFVVYDSSGLTYYLYNTGLTYGSRPSLNQKIYIIAIEDEYGNRIQYEYEDDYGTLTKIIDTYGREISIDKITGGKQISYYDDVSGETKTITYTSETLDASELDNDSPLNGKAGSRFIVTNQKGESTIYDSRPAEALNYYSSTSGDINDLPDPDTQNVKISSGYNIERIIYPTGSQTLYRYKCIYPINTATKTRSGVYAVEASCDVVDGKIENQTEYSFDNSGMSITVTGVNSSADKQTVEKYNSKGLMTQSKTTPQDEASPYKTVSYTYDSYNNPTKIETKENGTTSTMTYSYVSGYPNMLRTSFDGLSTVSYLYHDKTISYLGSDTEKTVKSNIASSVTYTDVSDSTVDYYIETTLTDDNKSIEYERAIKDDIIKSQIKYAYDSEGNVTNITQWTDDTNDDGVLDENDDVIELNSSYTVTAQKTKTVSSNVPDIINADGENEGAMTDEYSYNIYGSPLSHEDSYGTVTTIEYDDLNRPVKYNMPNGGSVQIEYNTAQMYTIITDAAGVSTKYEIDGLGRNKAKYTKDGSVYNKTEEYEYDDAGRVASIISYRSDSEGTKETYTYDALGRRVQKSVYELPDTLLYTEDYTYTNTSEQKVVTKTTTASDAEAAVQKSYYDIYGRMIKSESISDDTTLTALYEYDYLGRVTKATDANGNSTTYEYTYDGQVSNETDAAGNSVSAVYDLAGQAVSVTDANGNTTNTEYDKLGRTVKVTAPFSDTANSETKTYYDMNSNVVKSSVKRSEDVYQTTEYEYDNMGNLLGVIENDGTTDVVTQYQYDTANRMTKMITGLSEYTTSPSGGAVTTYSYDNRGYVYQIVDPMGVSEMYSKYDYAGNVMTVIDRNDNIMHNTYGAFGLVKTYFASSPETKEYVYNNLGQVITAKSVNKNSQTVEENYSYDAFGRLIETTSDDGSVQKYTYDANSNVTDYELVKDDTVENVISYTYNNLNQLTTLSNNDIITSYDYDAKGNITEKSLSTGVTTTYEYNNADLLTYTQSKNGGSVYTYSECSYLLNGLLQTVYMPYDGSNETGTKLKAYSYDSMGRLTGERVANEAGIPLSNTYSYDLRGNRIQEVASVPDYYTVETIDYTYDLNNRLTSTSSHLYNEEYKSDEYSNVRYYYDYNGNMTAKQTVTIGASSSSLSDDMSLSGHAVDNGMAIYRYDAFNRLSNYNSGSVDASYTYNANNLRASKTVNRETTNFVWNGQNLAAETKGDIISTYAYDTTGVHIANQNGTVTAYLKDYHGNIVGRTNTSGEMRETVSSRMDYDAFGNQWIGDSPDPFGYCGEYLDEESGLIYLRNRYYDSSTGRFITEDPAKSGLNWYSYCAGNPVTLIDPSGLVVTVSTADSAIVLAEMQALTDDELAYEEATDENGNLLGYGQIVIKNTYDTKRHVGQKLISDLINASGVVNINIGEDPNGDSNIKWAAFTDPNNIIQIYIEPNTEEYTMVETAPGEYERKPQSIYMIFGHELVHAWRELYGLFDVNDEEVGITPYDYAHKEDMKPAEEMKTMGINYLDCNGNQMQNYLTYNGIISENGLRIENNLEPRASYFRQ